MSRIKEINVVVTEYDEFYLVQKGYGEVHISVKVDKVSSLQKVLDSLDKLDVSQFVNAFNEF